MVAFTFNAAQHTPRFESVSGLSIGKHPVIIVDGEFKPRAASTPDQPMTDLHLKVTAIDGPDKGSTQTLQFTIQHPTDGFVRRDMDRLAAVCTVCGKQGFGDTSEIYNIPFIVEMGPQKSNDKYTEAKAVYFMDGRKPDEAHPAQQAPNAPLSSSAAGQNMIHASAAPASFQPGPNPPWKR